MKHQKKKIALISTGGTIEKIYDEYSGLLQNDVSVLDVMLDTLVLGGVTLTRFHLMNMDSLEMRDEHHAKIAEEVDRRAAEFDGVIVVHGTDSLSLSGEACYVRTPKPRVPVVFTGAIRPWSLRSTDSVQNLTEALLSVQLADPGIYVAMHGRLLQFPGVVKDRERMTFVKVEE